MERKSLEMIQPLVIAYGYTRNSDQITFLSYEREITIEGCNELLNKLLPLCNGVNRFEDILKKLEDEYEIESLMEVIKILLENEILIDSRDFYWVFHKRSMNPPLYFRNLSENEIADILRRRNYKFYRSKGRISLSSSQEIDSILLEFMKPRQSIWKYPSKNISFAQLSGLLKAAYGVVRRENLGFYTISHRTIPSAGALYPLELYVITLIDIDGLEKGLYYFQKEKEYLVPLKSGDFQEQLKELLLEANETIETASLFLIVTACFARGCEKYPNRGYRNILLEAGHLAQNVYLYCIDQNLGTVEFSGFLDEELGNFLEIDVRDEAPMTLLAVGSR
jgi:SagB-type dehydrogenase family enzyme